MKKLLFCLLFPLTLFASEEVTLNLAPSWQLVHEDGDEDYQMEVWMKECERIIFVETHAIEVDDYLNALKEEFPPEACIITYEHTDSSALVECSIEDESSALFKLIKTDDHFYLISITYDGYDYDSIDIDTWIAFLEDAICVHYS